MCCFLKQRHSGSFNLEEISEFSHFIGPLVELVATRTYIIIIVSSTLVKFTAREGFSNMADIRFKQNAPPPIMGGEINEWRGSVLCDFSLDCFDFGQEKVFRSR